MQDHGFVHHALVYLAAGVLVVPLAARRVVARFRRHDEEMLAEQATHRNDVKQLITMSQQGRQDLEQLLAAEAGKKP